MKLQLNDLVENKIIDQKDFDYFELTTLSSFQPHIGCSILSDFKTDIANKNVTNKSGFLAGIMRRYSKIVKKSESAGDSIPISASKVDSESCGNKNHTLINGFDDDDMDIVEQVFPPALVVIYHIVLLSQFLTSHLSSRKISHRSSTIRMLMMLCCIVCPCVAHTLASRFFLRRLSV